MAKSKLIQANKKIADSVTGGYRRIEKGAVGGYKRIEKGVVGRYKKIEKSAVDGFMKVSDAFVGEFLTKENESIEEARKRLAAEKKKREAARNIKKGIQ